MTAQKKDDEEEFRNSSSTLRTVWEEYRSLRWHYRHLFLLEYQSGELSIFSDEIAAVLDSYELKRGTVQKLSHKVKTSRQVNPNLTFALTLDVLHGKVAGFHYDIIDMRMTGVKLRVQQYEDASCNASVLVEDISSQNLLPSAHYTRALDVDKTSLQYVSDVPCVNITIELGSPVGGITIISHFEINLLPMSLIISHELILQILQVMRPSEISKKVLRKETLIRKTFVGEIKKTKKKDKLSMVSRIKGLSLKKRRDPIGQDPDDIWNETDELDIYASLPNRKTLFRNNTATPRTSHEKDLQEMEARAQTTLIFKHFRMGEIQVKLTYVAKKESNPLEDIRGFEIKVHSLVYSNKTCSIDTLGSQIQRDIIKDVLSQVNRNFHNIGIFLCDRMGIPRSVSTTSSEESSLKKSVLISDNIAAEKTSSSSSKKFQLEMPIRKPTLLSKLRRK